MRQAGTPTQQQQWLPRLAGGEAIGTLAVDEHAKHRPEATALRAAPQGHGWRLDGAKRFVLDGHMAALLIVLARSDGEAGDEQGLSLFAVPRDTPGVTVTRTSWSMPTTRHACNCRMSSCRPMHCSARPAAAWPTLQATLDAGRAAAAAELLGIADEVFDAHLGYLKERRQFGKPIGEFQGLQHRAATLYVDIELTPRGVAQGAAKPGRRPPERRGPCRGGCQGQVRQDGHAGGAGRCADARRHGHDRRVRDRLLHEARAGAAGAVSATPAFTWTGWRGCNRADHCAAPIGGDCRPGRRSAPMTTIVARISRRLITRGALCRRFFERAQSGGSVHDASCNASGGLCCSNDRATGQRWVRQAGWPDWSARGCGDA